jgi:hypothetical protein
MYAPATRARSRSGISAVLIEPPTMSRIITPKPERNSAAKSIGSTTHCDPCASGTSSSGAGKRKQLITNAGPTPSRRLIRPVRIEPINPPMAPAPRTSPSTPGRRPSVRVA